MPYVMDSASECKPSPIQDGSKSIETSSPPSCTDLSFSELSSLPDAYEMFETWLAPCGTPVPPQGNIEITHLHENLDQSLSDKSDSNFSDSNISSTIKLPSSPVNLSSIYDNDMIDTSSFNLGNSDIFDGGLHQMTLQSSQVSDDANEISIVVSNEDSVHLLELTPQISDDITTPNL